MSVQPSTLHVEPNGNDTSSGTIWAPLQTIAAAVTAAGVIGGEVKIKIAPGSYTVANPLTLTSGISLCGSGKSISLLTPANPTSLGFILSANTTMQDFTYSDQTGDIVISGNEGPAYVSRVSFQNCLNVFIWQGATILDTCYVRFCEIINGGIGFAASPQGTLDAYGCSVIGGSVIGWGVGGTAAMIDKANYFPDNNEFISGATTFLESDTLATITAEVFTANTNGAGINLGQNGLQTIIFDTAPTIQDTTTYAFTTGGTQVTVLKDGRYTIDFLIHTIENGGFGNRSDQRYTLYINGLATQFVSAGSYIRRALGHNEAGDCISAIVDLTAGSTIDIRSINIVSNTSPVIINGNECNLCIARKSMSVDTRIIP
jgi:hypothetical protein